MIRRSYSETTHDPGRHRRSQDRIKPSVSPSLPALPFSTLLAHLPRVPRPFVEEGRGPEDSARLPQGAADGPVVGRRGGRAYEQHVPVRIGNAARREEEGRRW